MPNGGYGFMTRLSITSYFRKYAWPNKISAMEQLLQGVGTFSLLIRSSNGNSAADLRNLQFPAAGNGTTDWRPDGFPTARRRSPTCTAMHRGFSESWFASFSI